MTTAREAATTVSFVDQYCSQYRSLFSDVRGFERFKSLQLGLLSEVKRKTFPAIARVVGAEPQALHHFVANAPWSSSEFRRRRLEVTKKALAGRSVTVLIDDTGDRKKGEHTDYVCRQYIGNVGKVDNGIVSVHAFGLLEGVTFPLLFDIFKPEKKLKEEEQHRSKPKIAVELIDQLCELGFEINLVLADCHYGESSDFISALWKHKLNFVVGIRSNHSVLMLPGWKVRRNRWKKFEREFNDGTQETRYIREVIFGIRKATRYYEITTDTETLPEESTWFIMTNLPGKIDRQVGNLYGERTWVESGFRNAKSELGWSDYKLTSYHDIERWWEMVCSAYLLVSLQSSAFRTIEDSSVKEVETARVEQPALLVPSLHQWWDRGSGWKNTLNNMRLVIQPYVCFWLLLPWLRLLEDVSTGIALQKLVEHVNEFRVFLQV
jgi:SRSO17 transposase